MTDRLDVEELRAEWGDAFSGDAMARFAFKHADALLDALEATQGALRTAQKVLQFADGVAVSNAGMALADLYAEDCEWAQGTLRDAGCWARGAWAAMPGAQKFEVLHARPPSWAEPAGGSVEVKDAT